MTNPGRALGPVGRGSDSFDGGHRHAENADLEGQPERGLVIDDYDSQTRGAGSLTQSSIGGIDPAVAALGGDAEQDRVEDMPDAEPG